MEPDEKKKGSENQPKNGMVFLHKLFRYSSCCDVFLILFGTIASIINGACYPVMVIFFSNIVDMFTEYSKLNQINDISNMSSTNTPINFDLYGKVQVQAIYIVVIGICTMIVGYIQCSFWLLSAESQANRIRKVLFNSILRHEMNWFDSHKTASLATRLNEDVIKIQDAISDKAGNFVQFLSTFVSGLIIGFVTGWKLTLVLLSLSPVLLGASIGFSKLVGYLIVNESKLYAEAGAVAEQALSGIKTVFAYNGGYKEYKKYEKQLATAKRYGIKKSAINGALMGFIWFVVNISYAIGFWYGWVLTNSDSYTVGNVLRILFTVVVALFSLGNASQYFMTLATGRVAAFDVFKIIDDTSELENGEAQGDIISEIVGQIEINNVSFSYVNRSEVEVLKNLNITIEPKSTIAIVGQSGSGKSTLVQLIQRLYNPCKGSIKLDGCNIKDLNIKWLRSNFGVVNQEPILFSTTIGENIAIGKENASQIEIEEAARAANIHDFIISLPNRYQTKITGLQISTGQKQRIAIARSLIRKPKILIFDEATSSLDNISEALVQEEIDRLVEGRTTIIVAHRLSTIRNANKILVMDRGTIVEYGTHQELINLNGIYTSLLEDQNYNAEQEALTKKTRKDPVSKDYSLRKETNFKTKIVEEKIKDIPFYEVFKLNKPEICYIIIGFISSIAFGGCWPIFSVLFSYVVGVFSKPVEQQEETVRLLCILFTAQGVFVFIANFLYCTMFGISGENLTFRLRLKAFKCMLSQELAWYDKDENSVGTLCTKLATDTAAVQGATGSRIGYFLLNIGNLGIGLILSLVFGWAITLLVLAFVPFIIIAGILQTRALIGFQSTDKKNLEISAQISNEVMKFIQTVKMYGKENYFVEQYSKKIDKNHKQIIRSTNIYGLLFGFSNAIMTFANAAGFVLGAHIIQNNLFGINFQDIMLVYGCVVFGSQAVGQLSMLMPDYAKAKVAINNLFALFDRIPEINNWTLGSAITMENDIMGEKSNFDLANVEFSYPSRKATAVLRNINLKITASKTVALVGPSGCGKSTIIQLLERFYDCDRGTVMYSNQNIKDLNLGLYRSNFGIVSQEPTMFNGTIQENIAYGDNSRDVSAIEIENAAKTANAHDFIISLPDGYRTVISNQGTQLSGGQKQRIAIARAVVKNPRILLLDEATSSLDANSQKAVQDALNVIQKGRTTIIVAHRLSTIKHADYIYVIKDGSLIEEGNHEELISLNGFYKSLYELNS